MAAQGRSRHGGYRRRFDPDKYLIIGLDQRGCGQSRPLAIDSPDTLALNTTHTLIQDIEALREQLGVKAWLLHGVSWGSTLALAYALEHPERVTEQVLAAVTTGSREEIGWITEGVGMLFPEAWERFASARRDDERVVEAYQRLLLYADPETGQAAATAWESAHISLDPNWTPGPLHEDPRVKQNFATLVTIYWSNAVFSKATNASSAVSRLWVKSP
jgi:proline iminopeptidase